MKRSLFITIGITIILILIAVWVYIIFFYTPSPTEDTYTDLNLPNNSEYPDSNQRPSQTPLVDIGFGDDKQLVQLTTGPVIGFQEITKPNLSTSTAADLYYIESGTGHIYSINLNTGEETRVSGTTIPSSKRGVITPDGLYTLIQSGSGGGSKFTVGMMEGSGDTMTTYQINERVVDFTTTVNNTFLYLTTADGGLLGREHNPSDRSTRTLFGIPFREADISWGQTASSAHYIYPKSNDQLEGYLYKTINGTFERLPVDGLGLSTIGNDSSVLFTTRTKDDYSTNIYNESTDNEIESIIDLIPQKCVSMEKNRSFVCASEDVTLDYKTFENWYEGSISYDDNLWEIYTPFGDTTLLLDVTKETGREIDIINLQTNLDNTNVYFQNKNDQALWWYKITGQ